ncbi:MAG: TatD family deoxyribonuclease [Actinomycetota bacterium]|nr:MAG: TatD family deoxyribonuclease [Actinomycetota bacterium]
MRDQVRPAPPEPLRRPVVDTHCHLDIRVGEDWLPVPDALAAAAAVGVTRVVQVGCDVASSRWSAQVAADHPAVRAAVALHPNETPGLVADGQLDAALQQIAALAALPQVAAVGETGLDLYRTPPEGLAAQEESLRAHAELARSVGKPLVVHDRDAHAEILRVLGDAAAPPTVVFHCFSGDAELARIVADNGWYLSFAGVVTFKNAQGLRDALAAVPLDRVLVETDAPFLTPTPFRGKPNASYLVPLTVRTMATVRGLSEEDMATALWDNAQRVFGPW